MIRAVLNGTVLAQSDQTQVVEGVHYFPPDTIDHAALVKSRLRTLCFWKGLASYYTITIGGHSYRHSAWYYPHPSPLARKIKNHVAFDPVVHIESD